MTPTTLRGAQPPGTPTTGRRRRWSRRTVALTAAVALPLVGASTALATTAVIKTNPGGLTAAGPVNSEYGFPAWYQDKSGQRVELCLDGGDPLCGFLPGDIPNPDAPVSFPTNFPDEAFYMLAGSSLTLPNGGKATLTLGLEAAFTNAVQHGDQVTFARQRIFVVGGPRNTTLHFHHPYGDIDIDTDASGDGRLTEDIAPSVGNFDLALKGNIGPFLTWDTGTVKPTTGGEYLGDPAIEHAVTGSPLGYNKFGVDWTDGSRVENAQFSVQGKVATNTGVKADSAVLGTDSTGAKIVDVFASSEADAGELFVTADTAAGVKTTPMASSTTAAGLKYFYARVAVTGSDPANVTVRNIGDSPTSSSQVAVTKASPITVTAATYDGAKLHVAASSTAPGATLSVTGYDAAVGTLADGVVDIATGAAPATVTVTDGANKGTATVQVTGGGITAPGEPPVPAGPAVDPVCTVSDPATGLDTTGPCPVGGPAPTAAPTANVAPVSAPVVLGDSVTLDASTSTNATSYEWTYKSGPQVTVTNGTTAKPTVKLAPYDVSKYTLADLPKAARSAPAVLSVVAVNGTTKSAPVEVSIPVKADSVAVTATKYSAGKEYRIDGTATTGGSLVLNPPTTVAIYNTTTGKLVGTAPVDTTGAFALRIRSPFPAGQDLARNITVVSTRGGYATGLVAGAPNL